MSTRPRAFRLDAPGTAVMTAPPASGAPDATAPETAAPETREAARVLVTEEPLDAIEAADGVPVLPPPRRGSPWGALLASALGGLVSLGIGVAIHRLVADLFATADWLGWLALALTALAALSLVAIAAREVRGVWRERAIERLRQRGGEALAVRDGEGAKAVALDLAGLYEGRTTRTAGPTVRSAADDIMDAEDRLALAERTLLAPLDAVATRTVAVAARQVSVVTAVSPKALIDVAFVVWACSRLLRQLSRTYGGRPGLLGFLRLARAAVNHLAVTGGAALGDGLLQSVLGHGLAARLSARLGEGVLNGLMTARFGLAAIEVCRPLPFVRETPPRLGDVAGDLLSREEGGLSRRDGPPRDR